MEGPSPRALELGEEAMRLEDAARELELRAARAKHDAEEAGAVAEKMAKEAAELAADTRKGFQVSSTDGFYDASKWPNRLVQCPSSV